MMAESLPFCGTTGTLSGWELEAWYEDLQDILYSDSKSAGVFQSVTSDEQELVPVEALDNSPFIWALDSVSSSLPVDFTPEDALALEAVVGQLPSGDLEFITLGLQNSDNVPSDSPEVEDTLCCVAAEPDSCCSSSPTYTLTDDEESSASPSGSKRKRSSRPQGGKVRVKEREQENERKVSHLVAENERLKGEIDRLSLEVEKTRKALIDRMVNLKKV
ncbi:DNA damage-inducible transcript 3 protein [Discoglossus pictus]